MAKRIIAKEDFLWYKAGQVINELDYNVAWGHLVTIIDGEEEVRAKLDLNKDGVVDEQDSIKAQNLVKEVKAKVREKKSFFSKKKK